MSATQLDLFNAQEFQVKPSIEDRFRTALECLDSIPNINFGGCGLSALSIYRWCKKNGVQVDDEPFVILCDDEWELSHNNACIEQGAINDVSIPHIAIQVDGELWDSTGNEPTVNYPYHTEAFGTSELIELLNEHGWNSWFNREKFLPIIEIGLEIDLSDIGKNLAEDY